MRSRMDVSFGDGESSRSSGGPSHVYLNVSAVNGDPGTKNLGTPVRATFTETRSTPIITDSSDYDMSVVRFSANGIGSALPLWIPQIQTGQTDVNLTILQLAIVPPSGPTRVQSLMWVPGYQDPIIAPVPQPPTHNQDLSSAYYFAQTYQQFCDMFNKALNLALAASGIVISAPCSLQYAGGGYFALNLDRQFNVNQTGVPSLPAYWLQLNPPLANLLYTFNTYYGYPPLTSQPFQTGFYTIIVPQTGPSAVPASDISYMSCDTPCTQSGLWNPIDSFAFVSNFLPIFPEQGTVPNVLGERNTGPTGITGAGFTNVISDIAFQGAPENALTSVLYAPTAEYRMTALAPNIAVNNVDVTLLWRYRLTGALIPVYLPNNANMTLKILFRRKDWRSK